MILALEFDRVNVHIQILLSNILERNKYFSEY